MGLRMSEGVLDDRAVLALEQGDANTCPIIRVAQKVIQGHGVEFIVPAS